MSDGLSLTHLDWAVGIGALAFNLALGLYFALRVKQTESGGFFLAGRRLTWPVIGASMFASNIGAEHLVGLSGDSYRYGICASAIELAGVLCFGIAAAFLYPYYIKNKVFTIPEFLEIRYRPEARLFFSGMMLFICIVTKMAFSLYAGALVLQSLVGWDIMATVLALGLITAVITMVGGFGVVAYTDAIHSPIMIAGSAVVLFIGLYEAGGWHAMLAAAEQAKPLSTHIYQPSDPVFPFWGVIAAAIYSGTFYWGIDQVNVQRVLGARNLDEARYGANFAILLKIVPVFIFALPGVIALALHANLSEPRMAFVWILNNLLPSGLRGYVLSALVGAVICSLIAVMNSASTMVVKDFILRMRPKTGEVAQVLLGRLTILCAMLLGVGAAYIVHTQPEGIYKYLQTISVYLVMPLTPAIVFGIMSKRVTFGGAVASMLVGVLLATLFVVDSLMDPAHAPDVFPFLHKSLTANYTYRGLWGNGIETAVLFLVSSFTKKTADEKLIKTTIDWQGKTEPFRGLADWRLQWIVLAILTALSYWLIW